MDGLDMSASDEVDFEKLQAQIDLSMAVADQLVSSWLPTSSAATIDGHDKRSGPSIEQELKDYLRRPQRLGVGAALPDLPSATSQGLERLRNKLVEGKKRRREDENLSRIAREDSDDEGEAGKGVSAEMASKRIRVDPFGTRVKPEAIAKERTGAIGEGSGSVIQFSVTNKAFGEVDESLLSQSKPAQGKTFCMPQKKKKKRKKRKQAAQQNLQHIFTEHISGSGTCPQASPEKQFSMDVSSGGPESIHLSPDDGTSSIIIPSLNLTIPPAHHDHPPSSTASKCKRKRKKRRKNGPSDFLPA